MVGDEEESFRVHLDGGRASKPLGHPQGRRLPQSEHLGIGADIGHRHLAERGVADERVDIPSRLVELLHSVVSPVGDVYVAVGIDSEPSGSVELQLSIAGGAKGPKELAVRGEFLYSVVAPVRNIDIAQFVDAYAPRHIELPIPAAVAAPTSEESPVLREFLNSVIHRIDDEHILVRVERKAGRSIETAFIAAMPSPAREEVAVFVEYGDAVQCFVRDVQVFLGVEYEG